MKTFCFIPVVIEAGAVLFKLVSQPFSSQKEIRSIQTKTKKSLTKNWEIIIVLNMVILYF